MKIINFKTILFFLAIIFLLIINFRGNSIVIDEKEEKIKAPEFQLPNLLNKKKSLKDFRGQYVLLNFWATWCNPCIYEMPSLERLHQRYKDKPFKIVAVSIDQDDRERINKFVNEHNYTFSILHDSDGIVSSAYKVYSIPMTFLIDPSGFILSEIQGMKSWDDKESFGFFDDLLSKEH